MPQVTEFTALHRRFTVMVIVLVEAMHYTSGGDRGAKLSATTIKYISHHTALAPHLLFFNICTGEVKQLV